MQINWPILTVRWQLRCPLRLGRFGSMPFIQIATHLSDISAVQKFRVPGFRPRPCIGIASARTNLHGCPRHRNPRPRNRIAPRVARQRAGGEPRRLQRVQLALSLPRPRYHGNIVDILRAVAPLPWPFGQILCEFHILRFPLSHQQRRDWPP